MQKPLARIDITHVGFRCHESPDATGDEASKRRAGAIAYIEKAGNSEKRELDLALEVVRTSLLKLQSLQAKGQVFQLVEYKLCSEAIANLQSVHQQAQGFGGLLMPGWEWGNSEIGAFLDATLAMDPRAMRQQLNTANAAILAFVRDSYARLYA